MARRFLLVLVIVLAACYAAGAAKHASATRHGSTCCPISHRAPSTHGSHDRQAQFQDAADHAIVVTPSLDRLVARHTSSRFEPDASRLSTLARTCPAAFNHTPTYLRTLVLLI